MAHFFKLLYCQLTQFVFYVYPVIPKSVWWSIEVQPIVVEKLDGEGVRKGSRMRKDWKWIPSWFLHLDSDQDFLWQILMPHLKTQNILGMADSLEKPTSTSESIPHHATKYIKTVAGKKLSYSWRDFSLFTVHYNVVTNQC